MGTGREGDGKDGDDAHDLWEALPPVRSIGREMKGPDEGPERVAVMDAGLAPAPVEQPMVAPKPPEHQGNAQQPGNGGITGGIHAIADPTNHVTWTPSTAPKRTQGAPLHRMHDLGTWRRVMGFGAGPPIARLIQRLLAAFALVLFAGHIVDIQAIPMGLTHRGTPELTALAAFGALISALALGGRGLRGMLFIAWATLAGLTHLAVGSLISPTEWVLMEALFVAALVPTHREGDWGHFLVRALLFKLYAFGLLTHATPETWLHPEAPADFARLGAAIALPLFIFGPRAFRLLGFALLSGLQGFILATAAKGTDTTLPWLVLILHLALLDDRDLAKPRALWASGRARLNWAPKKTTPDAAWTLVPTFVIGPVYFTVLVLTLMDGATPLLPKMPIVQDILASTQDTRTHAETLGLANRVPALANLNRFIPKRPRRAAPKSPLEPLRKDHNDGAILFPKVE